MRRTVVPIVPNDRGVEDIAKKKKQNMAPKRKAEDDREGNPKKKAGGAKTLKEKISAILDGEEGLTSLAALKKFLPNVMKLKQM